MVTKELRVDRIDGKNPWSRIDIDRPVSGSASWSFPTERVELSRACSSEDWQSSICSLRALPSKSAI
jgi:hypothetical protein